MQVLDNFESSYNKFLDARQSWDSLEALQENTDILMPNGFKAFCKEENKWYMLSTEDETDPSTYNWNESDGISIIELTQAEYDLLVENEEVENDRLYLITDGENYEGGSGGKGFDIVDEMPDTAPEKSIVFYNGTSTVDYAKGSFYQMINGNWTFLGATVKLIEVPFSLSLKSISPISENERSRELIFTSSEEIAITQETFNGVVASGVIQGKIWNDIGGSVSQVDETTFRVILDTDVTDSLGQPAQFVSGSSITIPAFSWIDGITKYTHAAETISISETTVQQKLLFNTTGNFDTNTASTSFTISGAYEIPFVLSYMNIPPVAMMDSNYENEIIQFWTSSIVAANDTTTLVFTPSDSTALHGDNIAITAGRLTAVANGVTYTYDFSTDNINLRWGNTSYNLGTFNNFASFTAVPTSANSGSVTCTLSPTGLGDDQFELDIMAANLPTVTIDSVQCGTVTWTQGQIVASGASEVSTVGGRTINIVWNDNTYSDTDSYGIARTVTFVAKALSVTCGYITKTITLSNAVPSLASGSLVLNFSVNESTSDAITLSSSDFSSTANGILQGSSVAVNSNGNATYNGSTFTISSFAGSVDKFGQRVVFPDSYTSRTATVGDFEKISGDYKIIHASQSGITITEEYEISTQSLDFRVLYPTQMDTAFTRDTSFAIVNTHNNTFEIDGVLSTVGFTNDSPSKVDVPVEILVQQTSGGENISQIQFRRTSGTSYWTGNSTIEAPSLLWGTSQEPLTISPAIELLYTKNGVTWKLVSQTTYVNSSKQSTSGNLDSLTVSSRFKENYTTLGLNFGNPIMDFFIAQLIVGKVVPSLQVNGTQFPFAANFGAANLDTWKVRSSELNFNREEGQSVEGGLLRSGSITGSIPAISVLQEVPNTDGFAVSVTASARSISGTHTFEEFFDDDDCD
jgi:hypothetical protein